MKIRAIAINTFREGVRQPVFYVLIALGAVLLPLSAYFTLFSFGEEARLVKDMGLATIALFGLLIALFTSSSVIADEIDKKTVLTVLCKPVSRVEFVLGKFFGIVTAAAVAMLILAAILCFATFLATRVDLHVNAHPVGHAFLHVPSILVGTLFAFLQVFVIAAVSVAVSTRFPMIVNVSVCLSLYVLGHVTRYLFISTDRSSLAGYLGAAAYALVPNLGNFNVAGAIALGQPIPTGYILLAVLYALACASVALLLALASFQTREVM